VSAATPCHQHLLKRLTQTVVANSGNSNRTGVCGTWENERKIMAATDPAKLRSDAGLDNASEVEWRWEPTAAELRQMRERSGDGAGMLAPNQQVWSEGNRYKLFGCNNFGMSSTTSL